MAIHLKVDYYQTDKHAQQVMKDLGITYSKAVPQTMFDMWLFFNCKNVPSSLPNCVTKFEIDKLERLIGYGLSPEDVEMLNNENKQA